MAVPKRRHSRARRDTRRAHDAIKIQSISFCPNCKEPKLPHRICPNCGYYNGREVIKLSEE